MPAVTGATKQGADDAIQSLRSLGNVGSSGSGGVPSPPANVPTRDRVAAAIALVRAKQTKTSEASTQRVTTMEELRSLKTKSHLISETKPTISMTSTLTTSSSIHQAGHHMTGTTVKSSSATPVSSSIRHQHQQRQQQPTQQNQVYSSQQPRRPFTPVEQTDSQEKMLMKKSYSPKDHQSPAKPKSKPEPQEPHNFVLNSNSGSFIQNLFASRGPSPKSKMPSIGSSRGPSPKSKIPLMGAKRGPSPRSKMPPIGSSSMMPNIFDDAFSSPRRENIPAGRVRATVKTLEMKHQKNNSITKNSKSPSFDDNSSYDASVDSATINQVGFFLDKMNIKKDAPSSATLSIIKSVGSEDSQDPIAAVRQMSLDEDDPIAASREIVKKPSVSSEEDPIEALRHLSDSESKDSSDSDGSDDDVSGGVNQETLAEIGAFIDAIERNRSMDVSKSLSKDHSLVSSKSGQVQQQQTSFSADIDDDFKSQYSAPKPSHSVSSDMNDEDRLRHIDVSSCKASHTLSSEVDDDGNTEKQQVQESKSVQFDIRTDAPTIVEMPIASPVWEKEVSIEDEIVASASSGSYTDADQVRTTKPSPIYEQVDALSHGTPNKDPPSVISDRGSRVNRDDPPDLSEAVIRLREADAAVTPSYSAESLEENEPINDVEKKSSEENSGIVEKKPSEEASSEEEEKKESEDEGQVILQSGEMLGHSKDFYVDKYESHQEEVTYLGTNVGKCLSPVIETPSAESDDHSVSGDAACVKEEEIIVIEEEEEIIVVEDLVEEARSGCEEPPIPRSDELEGEGEVGFEVEEGECGFDFEVDEAEHEDIVEEEIVVEEEEEEDMVDYEELLIEALGSAPSTAPSKDAEENENENENADTEPKTTGTSQEASASMLDCTLETSTSTSEAQLGQSSSGDSSYAIERYACLEQGNESNDSAERCESVEQDDASKAPSRYESLEQVQDDASKEPVGQDDEPNVVKSSVAEASDIDSEQISSISQEKSKSSTSEDPECPQVEEKKSCEDDSEQIFGISQETSSSSTSEDPEAPEVETKKSCEDYLATNDSGLELAKKDTSDGKDDDEITSEMDTRIKVKDLPPAPSMKVFPDFNVFDDDIPFGLRDIASEETMKAAGRTRPRSVFMGRRRARVIKSLLSDDSSAIQSQINPIESNGEVGETVEDGETVEVEVAPAEGKLGMSDVVMFAGGVRQVLETHEYSNPEKKSGNEPTKESETEEHEFLAPVSSGGDDESEFMIRVPSGGDDLNQRDAASPGSSSTRDKESANDNAKAFDHDEVEDTNTESDELSLVPSSTRENESFVDNVESVDLKVDDTNPDGDALSPVPSSSTCNNESFIEKGVVADNKVLDTSVDDVEDSDESIEVVEDKVARDVDDVESLDGSAEAVEVTITRSEDSSNEQVADDKTDKNVDDLVESKDENEHPDDETDDYVLPSVDPSGRLGRSLGRVGSDEKLPDPDASVIDKQLPDPEASVVTEEDKGEETVQTTSPVASPASASLNIQEFRQNEGAAPSPSQKEHIESYSKSHADADDSPTDPSGRMGHNLTDEKLPDPEASYLTDNDEDVAPTFSTNASGYDEHPAISEVRSPESLLEALQDEIDFTKAAYNTESSGDTEVAVAQEVEDLVQQQQQQHAQAPMIATVKSPESLHEEVEFTQEAFIDQEAYSESPADPEIIVVEDYEEDFSHKAEFPAIASVKSPEFLHEDIEFTQEAYNYNDQKRCDDKKAYTESPVVGPEIIVVEDEEDLCHKEETPAIASVKSPESLHEEIESIHEEIEFSPASFLQSGSLQSVSCREEAPPAHSGENSPKGEPAALASVGSPESREFSAASFLKSGSRHEEVPPAILRVKSPESLHEEIEFSPASFLRSGSLQSGSRHEEVPPALSRVKSPREEHPALASVRSPESLHEEIECSPASFLQSGSLQSGSGHEEVPPAHSIVKSPKSLQAVNGLQSGSRHEEVPPAHSRVKSPKSPHAVNSFQSGSSLHEEVPPAHSRVKSPKSPHAVNSFQSGSSLHEEVPPAHSRVKSPKSPHAVNSFQSGSSLHEEVPPAHSRVKSPKSPHAVNSFQSGSRHEEVPPAHSRVKSPKSPYAVSSPRSGSRHEEISPAHSRVKSPRSTVNSPKSPLAVNSLQSGSCEERVPQSHSRVKSPKSLHALNSLKPGSRDEHPALASIKSPESLHEEIEFTQEAYYYQSPADPEGLVEDEAEHRDDFVQEETPAIAAVNSPESLHEEAPAVASSPQSLEEETHIILAVTSPESLQEELALTPDDETQAIMAVKSPETLHEEIEYTQEDYVESPVGSEVSLAEEADNHDEDFVESFLNSGSRDDSSDDEEPPAIAGVKSPESLLDQLQEEIEVTQEALDDVLASRSQESTHSGEGAEIEFAEQFAALDIEDPTSDCEPTQEESSRPKLSIDTGDESDQDIPMPSVISPSKIAKYFVSLDNDANISGEQARKIHHFQKLIAPVIAGNKPSIIEAAQIRQSAQKANVRLEDVDRFLDFANDEGIVVPTIVSSTEDDGFAAWDCEMEELNQDDEIVGFLSRFGAGPGGHKEKDDIASNEDVARGAVEIAAIGSADIDAAFGYVTKSVEIEAEGDEEEEWWKGMSHLEKRSAVRREQEHRKSSDSDNEESENGPDGNESDDGENDHSPKSETDSKVRNMDKQFSPNVSPNTDPEEIHIAAASFAYDSRTENAIWQRKKAMANETQSIFLSPRRQIDGVAAMEELGRFAFGKQILASARRPWKLPYRERTKNHPGFFDVDVNSVYESTVPPFLCEDVGVTPWEHRDVKQRFLNERSVVFSRNWFGDLQRVRGNPKYKQPFCKPKSMEMPMENIPDPGEWTEEWYTVWKSPYDRRRRRAGASESSSDSSTTEGSFTITDRGGSYTTDGSTAAGKSTSNDDESEYSGSSDDGSETDNDDATWEEAPECGILINVKQKIGERVSRIHPDYTSSLRKSRWRKKYFPRGTFPYK